MWKDNNDQIMDILKNIGTKDKGYFPAVHSIHALYRLPNWWENLGKVNTEKLTSFPDYLEENKACIDEWVNKLTQHFNNNNE